MSDGFLGRWSQRKLDTRQGKPLQEPTALPTALPPDASNTASSPTPPNTAQASAKPGQSNAGKPDPTQKPAADLPTLEDAKALTKDSDFSPFMSQGVSPDVKNAAMKKLFTDPHFNVMDGLDTYIDDYSKPDPLPLSLMRKMTSAQFLNLFDEDKEKKAANPKADNPNNQPTLSDPQDHANTDLRLQQDHAPAAQGAGRSPE